MRTRLTEAMNIRYPLCSAGMAMIATPPLVSAVSAAGALGILGTGPAPLSWIKNAIHEIRDRTDKPFGINLIAEHTAFGPLCTDDHVRLCIREAVDLVVFFWQLPPAGWNVALRKAGIPVWVTVGERQALQAAINLEIDGLILQGREAGGHVKSDSALADLILEARKISPELLLIGAGGIANSADIRRILELGADGACLGTRFVASEEADAHPEYQQRIIDAGADDTTITEVFGPEWAGVPMRVIRNRASSGEVTEPQIGQTMLFGRPYVLPAYSAVLPTVSTEGDFDAMCLAAGQSVRSIDAVKPAGEIVRELFADWFEREVLTAPEKPSQH